MNNRIRIALNILLAIVLSLVIGASVQAADKPNIVLIVSDDFDTGTLGSTAAGPDAACRLLTSTGLGMKE